MVKSTSSGQLKGKARPATAMKTSIKDAFVQKRTKLVTENVQCLASKNLFTGNQKTPNHWRVLSSWLYATGENQKTKFGS